jgi:thiamine kinase-like enzyme
VFNSAKVKEGLDKILSETERVLSHNDCHTGNIMITSERIYILDFEFSQFNFIGFDLGNFLNEWAIEYGASFEIRE